MNFYKFNMNGYEFTKSLRDVNCDIPILMITAKDDYMTKPIDLNEMILRVEALLRRSKIIHDRMQKIGKTILDYDSLSVTRNGNIIVLPQKEFYLLYKLVSYPNKIFTRTQIMNEI